MLHKPVFLAASDLFNEITLVIHGVRATSINLTKGLSQYKYIIPFSQYWSCPFGKQEPPYIKTKGVDFACTYVNCSIKSSCTGVWCMSPVRFVQLCSRACSGEEMSWETRIKAGSWILSVWLFTGFKEAVLCMLCIILPNIIKQSFVKSLIWTCQPLWDYISLPCIQMIIML